jgi:hypothetical protein
VQYIVYILYLDCLGARSVVLYSTTGRAFCRIPLGPARSTPISYEVGVLCAGSFRRVKPSGLWHLDMVDQRTTLAYAIAGIEQYTVRLCRILPYSIQVLLLLYTTTSQHDSEMDSQLHRDAIQNAITNPPRNHIVL